MSNGVFQSQSIKWRRSNFYTTDPACYGNEIWDKKRLQLRLYRKYWQGACTLQGVYGVILLN